MTKPLLSICIPTYNRRSTLQATLESVISQVQHSDSIELCISDNASTDGTTQLITDYQEKYSYIRYSRNTANLGFDGNISACINQSNGKYISFLSDDDIVLPGHYQRIIEEIISKSPSIIYTNHYPFRDDALTNKSAFLHQQEDMLFEVGRDFLLFAGLGFISALTLKSEYAKHFLGDLAGIDGTSHLELAARIALSTDGPFSFIGTSAIKARSPLKHTYNAVTYCCVNVAKVYHVLGEEALLDQNTTKSRICEIIRHDLPRCIASVRCEVDDSSFSSQVPAIIETFGRYASFYWYAYPVILLPQKILKMICVGLQNMKRRYMH